ncbi:MAG: hypothetical protein IPH12_14505 [Saprospirales bacterium]|nr:hypothetical protein [Saprospirales bacterium]
MKILYHPSVLGHDTGDTHPENRRRLLAFEGLEPEPVAPDGARSSNWCTLKITSKRSGNTAPKPSRSMATP